jgi:endonuclease/exonuclease/phosphatase family metal-dependent hydrolase
MRLVTLNTWKCDGAYSRRLAAMEAGLGALAADVILLQEDFWAPDFDLHTAGRLAQALGLTCHSVPLRKKDRVVEGAIVSSFSGLSVLSRFPVLWDRTVDLPTHPDDGERSSQAVCLESSAGPLLVINLHLTHLAEAEEIRRRQLAATLQAARDGTFCGVVVGGDFNTGPDGLRAAQDDGFADVRRLLGGQHFSTLQDGSACLDHFLIRTVPEPVFRPTAVTEAMRASECDGFAPSDHLAVVLDLVRT